MPSSQFHFHLPNYPNREEQTRKTTFFTSQTNPSTKNDDSRKKIETFKMKVNENLKNLNVTMTNMIQESIDGVDNLCSQVRGCICENEYGKAYLENYNVMQNCERGDATVTRTRSDKKFRSQTDKTPEEFPKNDSDIRFQESVKKKPPPMKTNFENLFKKRKSKIKEQESNNLLTATESSNGEKAKKKYKNLEQQCNKNKVIDNEETKFNTGINVRKRIGEIEEDYQKVVENLNMVEKMMAFITEKYTNQKKETVKVKENLTNWEKNDKSEPEKHETIHPFSIIKTRADSSTNIDLLIDNAVQKLGNLVATDFGNVSQNSSYLSFKNGNTEGAHNAGASSLAAGFTSISDSEDSADQDDQDCDKFELSRSFQELKDSYLRKLEEEQRALLEKKETAEEELDVYKREENAMSEDNKTFKANSTKNREKPTYSIDVVNESNYAVTEKFSNTKMEMMKPLELVGKIKMITAFSSDKESEDSSRKATRRKKRINGKKLEGAVKNTAPSSENEEKFKKTDLRPVGNETQEKPTEKRAKRNVKAKTQKTKKPKENKSAEESLEEDFTEIKSVESCNSRTSSLYASTSSSVDNVTTWKFVENPQKPDQKIETEEQKIDPMRQLSIQCQKLLSDLTVVENHRSVSLEKIMAGKFDREIIENTLVRLRRPISFRTHLPVQDPELSALQPEVHRKKAVSDLHERMEYQIRQTDSLDGFLNLMDKERRKAMIMQAEKQDHKLKCQLRVCFRKKYPFRVATSYVPYMLKNRTIDDDNNKKDSEGKKYVNSLWFSPRDFKLHKNSKIFNKRRLEMYCQTLNKGPSIHKSRSFGLKEQQKNEKPSNYSILVRSGTPIGRRPSTPRRGLRTRSTILIGRSKKRLNHCDILDDLTLKDLAPFKAEYPRRDVIVNCHHGNLKNSLLYKLACGAQTDLEGALSPPLSPALSRSLLRRRKIKKTRKSDDETPPGAQTEIRALSAKAAAKLLIKNIGEIRKKNVTSEKNKNLVRKKNNSRQNVNNNNKRRHKSSKLADEHRWRSSRSSLHVKSHNNLFRPVKTGNNAAKPPENCVKAKTKTSINNNNNKLLPYLNDPENRVFQRITVLPVTVTYNLTTLGRPGKRKNGSEIGKTFDHGLRGPSVSARSCEAARAAQGTAYEVERVLSAQTGARPSTADDPASSARKMKPAKRRAGTPRSRGNRSAERKSAIDVATCVGKEDRRRRSRSFERKSTVSENGASFKSYRTRRFPNKIPWKPASRRPRIPTPPSTNTNRIVVTGFNNKTRSLTQQQFHNRCACVRTFASVKSTSDFASAQKKRLIRTCEKCLADNCDDLRAADTSRTMIRTNVSDGGKAKNTTSRYHRNVVLPARRTTIANSDFPKSRISRTENDIRKSIEAIEVKMVDVLNAHSDAYRKKNTIDTMEKEINKVLSMINEENDKRRKCDGDNEGNGEKNGQEESETSQTKMENFERSENCTNEEVKKSKPPRKRSISRLIKFHSKPRIVVELENNNKSVQLPTPNSDNETKKNEEKSDETKEISEEKPPKCASSSLVEQELADKAERENLKKNTRKSLKKMSREAFGKFADLVRNKTSLIIEMTNNANFSDAEMLPRTDLLSTFPGILAQENLPLSSNIELPTTLDDAPKSTPATTLSVAPEILNAELEILTTKIEREISATSFTALKEPENSYVKSNYSIDLRPSTCPSRKWSSNDDFLFPFARTLENFDRKSGCGRKKCLFSLENASPSFWKLVDFLGKLVEIKREREVGERKTSRIEDLGRIWAPEKRVRFDNDVFDGEKSNSRAAMMAFLRDENPREFVNKIEKKPSLTNIIAEIVDDVAENSTLEKSIYEEENVRKIEEIFAFDDAQKMDTSRCTFFTKSEPIRLVFSDVHLFSVREKESKKKTKKRRLPFEKKKEEEKMDEETEGEGKLSKKKREDTNGLDHSNFLKFFYFVYYAFLYFFLTVNNFSC